MFAVCVNIVTIVVGSLIGLLVKNNLKKNITDAIMVGIGFFTVYIGITGLSTGVSSIVYLISIILGGVTGTALKIDERVDSLALKLQGKIAGGDAENRFAAGFAGFFIMSSVGAFTIVASFNAGIGDNAMLLTKAAMDLIVSMAMASSLGIGVLFAGIPIILYELILVIFSGFLSSVLGESMIEAFSCMGAILTIAIGANVTGITKFKVVNYVPGLVFAPIIALIFEKML